MLKARQLPVATAVWTVRRSPQLFLFVLAINCPAHNARTQSAAPVNDMARENAMATICLRHFVGMAAITAKWHISEVNTQHLSEVQRVAIWPRNRLADWCCRPLALGGLMPLVPRAA